MAPRIRGEGRSPYLRPRVVVEAAKAHGRVNAANVADYLAVPEVVCCGGTWIVPKDALARGDYAEIERLACEASQMV